MTLRLSDGLALQRRADLDRFDLALEDPGERATDQALEAAFEALGQAHDVLLGRQSGFAHAR